MNEITETFFNSIVEETTRAELRQSICTAETATGNEVAGPVCSNVQPSALRRTKNYRNKTKKETSERKVSLEDSRRRETERAEAFPFENKQLKFSSPMTPKVHLIGMKQFLTSPDFLVLMRVSRFERFVLLINLCIINDDRDGSVTFFAVKGRIGFTGR